MKFWSKTKHGEKKLSREKQTSMSEAGDTHGKINNTKNILNRLKKGFIKIHLHSYILF